MAGSVELASAVVASLSDESELDPAALSVLQLDSDYAFCVRFALGDSGLLKLYVPESETELLDVILTTRDPTAAKFLSNEAKADLNRRLDGLRTLHHIADCLRMAKRWWSETGESTLAEAMKPAWRKKKDAKRQAKTASSGNKLPKTEPSPPESSDSLKSSQDVVSRLLWDDVFPKDDFTVGYIDRFVGVVEKAFSSFRWERFSTVDPEETAIPRHRIVWFKYNGIKVWDRESKLDLIFGSGIPPKTGPTDIFQLLPAKMDESEDDDDEELPAAPATRSRTVSDAPTGVRPDFYLSIPVTSPALVTQLGAVQGSLSLHFPDVVKKAVPEDQLHVTLGLFSICRLGDSGIHGVAAALRRRASELRQALASMGPLRFRGLKLLAQYKVVVSEPENVGPLWSVVKAALRDAGVPFYAPSSAHLTLARLRRGDGCFGGLDGMCQVSRFRGEEPSVSLSLKELGEQAKATERLAPDFPGPGDDTAAYSPDESDHRIGFHVRSDAMTSSLSS